MSAAGRGGAYAGALDAARPASHEPAQQPTVRRCSAGAERLIVLASTPRCLKCLARDNGRRGHGDPIFGGSQATCRLRPRRPRKRLMAIPVGGAGIRRVAQQGTDRRTRPQLPTIRALDAVGVQAPRDLTDRMAAGHIVIEDPSDDFSLGLVDLQVSWARVGPRHPPVAVGNLCEDRLAGSHPV